MEMVHDHIVTVQFPAIVVNLEIDSDSRQYINRLISNLLSQFTIWRWCQKLGLRYKMKKNIYYVDGREHPSQRFVWKKVTKQYLTELEPRYHS